MSGDVESVVNFIMITPSLKAKLEGKSALKDILESVASEVTCPMLYKIKKEI